MFDPWAGKTPWRRERLPAPVFWPGKFHGRYPLGCKESDTTKQLSFTFHIPVVNHPCEIFIELYSVSVTKHDSGFNCPVLITHSNHDSFT